MRLRKEESRGHLYVRSFDCWARENHQISVLFLENHPVIRRIKMPYATEICLDVFVRWKVLRIWDWLRANDKERFELTSHDVMLTFLRFNLKTRSLKIKDGRIKVSTLNLIAWLTLFWAKRRKNFICDLKIQVPKSSHSIPREQNYFSRFGTDQASYFAAQTDRTNYVQLWHKCQMWEAELEI